MNLPLTTRVDLLADLSGSAIDCRMMFLGDTIRLLFRTHTEIVRRFKMFRDPDHLFRSLQGSDEIKQFYEIEKRNGVTSVTMRDSVFKQNGSLQDVKIDLRFRLNSKHLTVPLSMENICALGNLLPLLRKDSTEIEIRDSLQAHLEPERLVWAMKLLAQLGQHGFLTESPLPRNHFQLERTADRLTFMGHSSLLLQTSKTNVLTDPYLRLDDGLPDYALDVARTKLNAIVCSHGHYDHCDLQSFLWFDKDTLLIVPKVKEPTAFNPPVITPLRLLGFRNFLEVDLWKPVQIGEDVELIPVPFHGEQDEPGAKNDHFTYVLRSKDLSLYAGVDASSDTFGEMMPVLEQVRERYHPFLAFLPVSDFSYGYDSGGANGFLRYLDTILIDQKFQYTASPQQATEWVKALQPKWVAPYAIFHFSKWSPRPQVPKFERALKGAKLEKHFFPLRPYEHLDASDFSRSMEFRRHTNVWWFRASAKIGEYDQRFKQNRIYRYLRYRGKPARPVAEHH